MKYLPSNLFWDIIKKACIDSNNLADISGELENINFWPKWNSTDTKNTNYVEPDVFVSFTNFDIILEIKPNEDSGQYEEQWSNQLISYNNEFEESNKNLYYITLGGNTEKSNESITVGPKNIKYTINKCNWMGVLIEVSNTLKELKKINSPILNKNATIILLEDIIRGFNYYGFFNVNWFEGMEMYKIEI
ncbi:hypothetical protein F7644_12295 [Tenacibaculum finnmarkense genomovar ulcerans]|uniref:hypothetical protein n=1 Tax=Tenacibaculum finnmarkense TaxID=2781243 RepID=UPI00187B2B54|nr:hypothetical protein [Tenacibaculum finnmarkense]MBE7646760.1 hypothetical protein [Tenacibaculum finnmarkense genomovar ulcerans]